MHGAFVRYLLQARSLLFRQVAFDCDFALDAMHEALSPGVKSAKLFFRAGIIYLAAGRTGEGKQFLREAGEINPHYQDCLVQH